MSEQSGSLLRQTLMNVDECFVYRVPPMATSGGHRAENWDLSTPLETCGLQVERRDNDLFLLFTTESHTKLFALAKCQSNPARSVEPVMDSSRYFVTHIQNNQGKSALIGFGFRERDVAIDLLGNLQQFQKSIERELQAKSMKVKEIPKLGEGEKIHVNLGTSKRKSANASSKKKNSGGPFLLKKPPKFASAEEDMISNVSDMDLAAKKGSFAGPEPESIAAQTTPLSISGGADDEFDELGDDWNDFQEATQSGSPS
ncbi:unnamed protein product [Cylindrotheca closterium]|uniref:NECAP PHear domain-containing protein n=1 Tax=Cylindrotheca closterium TaxID=2856 RepID=A0AAD2FX59_9STRA|nr:unnamed protein product [Cylindrotheca closterium]